jgi:hypothetical protein
MNHSAYTAPVYSHVYEVPQEIQGGKAADWLAAYEKTVAGIPVGMRHRERLREVFSATLAVRVARLDAGEWGKKLYGDGTVARQVYDVLGKILAGDATALPVLVDTVPADEKIGGGWGLMANGLYHAKDELGDKVAARAPHILVLASMPFPVYLPKEERDTFRKGGFLNVFRSPDETMQPITEAIGKAKGGQAWQTYRQRLSRYLMSCISNRMIKTRSMAKLALDLADDPRQKNIVARSLRELLPGEATRTQQTLDRHELKATGDPRAALRLAENKRKEGAYEEALALYRQAEEGSKPGRRAAARHGQFMLLLEAQKKGATLSTTFAAELARRKQASAGGDSSAVLAYADALLCAGQTDQGVALAQRVAVSESAPNEVRLSAWKLSADAAPEDAWKLAATMPQVFAKGSQTYTMEALFRGVGQSQFASAAEWLGAVRAEKPTINYQAREALLWCAAGKPERAKAVLTIDAQHPKQSIMVLTQFLQADESWAYSGSGEVNLAAVAAMKKGYPPGSGWPLGVDYALRILAHPVLRRERETTAVWQQAIVRMPLVESKETTALGRKVTAAGVAWAKESLPAAVSLFDRTAMVFNGWLGRNPARIECAQVMLEETLAILAARKVPEKELQSTLFQLRAVFRQRHMSEAQKRAVGDALLSAYPSLAEKWPELKKE